MSLNLAALLWPASSSPRMGAAPPGTPGTPGEVATVEIAWPDLPRALRLLPLTALRLPGPCAERLRIVAHRRSQLTLLAPDGATQRASANRLAAALHQRVEERIRGGLDPGWQSALGALSPGGQRRARRAWFAMQLQASPGVVAELPLAATTRRSQRPWIFALAVAVVATQAMAAAALWSLGDAWLAGRWDAGAAQAWALLVLSLAAVRAAMLAARSGWGRALASRTRQALMNGILAAPAETLQGDGSHRQLARLLAAERYERSLLQAVPGGALAIAEAVTAGVVLSRGAAATALIALLAACGALILLLARRGLQLQRAATCSGTARSAALAEAMGGQRTRRLQAKANHVGGDSHDGDDDAEDSDDSDDADDADDAVLAEHHRRLCRLDAHETLTAAVLPRAWALVALAALLPAVVLGGTSPRRLALALVGVALARGALARLALAWHEAATARIAWQEIRPLLGVPKPRTTARTPDGARTEALASDRRGAARPTASLEAWELQVDAPGNGRRLLDGTSFTLEEGERCLLTGPSGGGKSTLAGILAGRRRPAAGALLLQGYDLPAIGARAWRRRIVVVPQLHANHLFAATLAWNLLLGRDWPPSEADRAAAREVCGELGLGPLLERLPAGLEQPVGDAGWRLSDGEMARVCLARALLQEPDVLILDESLAALDAELRLTVLAAIVRRARTLVLIAHLDLPPEKPFTSRAASHNGGAREG